MPNSFPRVDVASAGINSTDGLMGVPYFPDRNSKIEFRSSQVVPGGQIASIMAACSRRDLRCRYAGTIGDDSYGDLQKAAVREGETLGEDGVLAWDGSDFHYHAFEATPKNTTGAEDIFHAAFAYALRRDGELDQQLEFCSAAATLSCTKLRARGVTSTIAEIRDLVRPGRNRPGLFSKVELEAAKAT